MAADWEEIFGQTLRAAEGSLADKWPLVQQAATCQIKALIENAQALEDSKGTLSPAEYELVKRIQQRALTGILASYEAIGLVAAEQAAEAAWGVVAVALKAATGLPFIL